MKYNTSLGEGIDTALTELDELLSSGTLELLTELWDTERGGFYRSAEERERRGFLVNFNYLPKTSLSVSIAIISSSFVGRT